MKRYQLHTDVGHCLDIEAASLEAAALAYVDEAYGVDATLEDWTRVIVLDTSNDDYQSFKVCNLLKKLSTNIWRYA